MSGLAKLFFLLACLGAWSGNASAAVTWQAAGTAVSGTTAAGVGANPAWPAHAVNDIALLFVESTGGQPVTLSVPNGFVAVPNSPQATGSGTAGTQLTVFWARATSSAMAAPRIASPSDHFYARIITFRGVINNGNPWDVTGGGVKAVTSTSVTVTGVTTTVANTLVVQAVARDNDNAAAAFSAQTNASLSGIAERHDAGTANGNGGGLGIWSGIKATAGATGNTTATVTSSINAFLTIALKPQPGPRFQAAGAAVGGTATVSPAWPAHAVDDIALLFVESTGGQPATLSIPAGFVAVANSPQATGAGLLGTQLTVFWARATSAAMTAPTVADPGDHVYAQIITYRGAANIGNPWDVTGGGVKTPASTALGVTGVTTTVADTLIVQAAARDNDNAAAAFSAQTNASLTGIAERSDAGTTQGNGGGFAVWDGYKATASATGNTTATVTSSINAFLTIALKPQASSVPVFGAAGTAIATGLNWPTHAIDDVALLFVESAGGQIPTLADAAGFVEVPNSPQATGAGTAGTRLTVFWARATSVAMVGPTITGPADHAYAQIITYRGASNSGNPWDVTGGGVKTPASTSVTVAGVTTTVPNTRIVQAVARDNDNAAAAFSAETNANLTGIAERSDLGTTTGLGGGFAVWDGAKATAGATGNTTATVTSSINAFLTIALKPPTVAGPDHYELSLPTASVACLASTATITACADNTSPCTNPYAAASGTTANLATSAGTLGFTTVTFDATGVATTTLSYPAAADGATATVTLSGEQTAATNPRKCCQSGICVVANSCTSTFNTAGFIFSGAANGAVVTVSAQVAGTPSGTYYLRAVKTNTTTKACETALTGITAVNFAYECNNPATCYASNLMSLNGGTATAIARNNNGSVSSYLPVNMTFDANGNAPFTFTHSDVGQVKLYASKAAGGALLSTLAGFTNAFVVKPGGFVLSGIQQTAAPNLANPAAANAAGAKFVKAGEAFSATVTAVTSTGSTAYNFGKETAPESVKLTSALVSGLGQTNNPALAGTFGAFANGAATGTTFAWSEAGIITLTPSVSDGDYLGAGDTTGTTTANIGRFYAAQFALSGGTVANRTDIAGCTVAGCGSFTYMGEQMNALFTLTAKAADGTTTLQNYNWSATPANQFAKLDPVAAVTAGTGGPLGLGAVNSAATRTPFPPCGVTPAHPCFTPAQATAGAFSGGVASITVPIVLYRDSTAPAGPYAALDIGVAPQDSDGAIMAAYDLDTVNVVAGTNNHAKAGSTGARYGRLKLSNAHGSELLPLPVAVTAQYWDGSSYATNTSDNQSVFAVTDVILSNYQKNLAPGETSVITPPASVVFVNGIAGYRLAAPSAGNNGSVDMTVNVLSAYLPGNAARATLGVYKGSNEFIYLRENY